MGGWRDVARVETGLEARLADLHNRSTVARPGHALHGVGFGQDEARIRR